MFRQVVKLTTCYLLLGSIKGENNSNDKAINDTTKPKREVLTGNPLDYFIYPSANEGNNYFKPIQVAEPSQINQLTASTDNIIYEHSNGQLQDSYGNRFQDSPYATQLQQQKVPQQPAAGAVHQQFSFQADQPQAIFLQNMQLPYSQTFQKQLQAQNYQASNTFSVPHRDLGTIPVDFTQISEEKNKAIFSQPLTENIRAPQGPSSYQQLQQQFANNLNGFNAPQYAQSTVPARLQAHPQSKQPIQQFQKPRHPVTLGQIKTIHPQFLKPQVFANPIVPQHQHFLPPIRYFLPKVHQVSADVATTVAPLPPPPPPPPTQQSQRNPPQAEDKPRIVKEENKRDGMKHRVREEVKGVIIREEEGGEDDFEDGYRESARGFPSYNRGQKDESDDDRSEAQDDDDDESSEHHQSNSYSRDQDDDDDESNSYSPEHSDGQSRRNNYYRERGHTRHSSDDQEPRKSSYRSSYKIKSKPKSYYSQKYSSDDSSKPKYSSYRQYSADEDRPKYYNSRPDSQYRKGNNRYEKYRSYSDAEDSYHDNSAPVVTKSKFVAPKSEYGGFEPIPHSSDSSPADSRTKLTSAAPAPGDAKAATSRPGTKRKLYKENWFISKTKTA